MFSIIEGSVDSKINSKELSGSLTVLGYGTLEIPSPKAGKLTRIIISCVPSIAFNVKIYSNISKPRSSLVLEAMSEISDAGVIDSMLPEINFISQTSKLYVEISHSEIVPITFVITIAIDLSKSA